MTLQLGDNSAISIGEGEHYLKAARCVATLFESSSMGNLAQLLIYDKVRETRFTIMILQPGDKSNRRQAMRVPLYMARRVGTLFESGSACRNIL